MWQMETLAAWRPICRPAPQLSRCRAELEHRQCGSILILLLLRWLETLIASNLVRSWTHICWQEHTKHRHRFLRHGQFSKGE